MIPWLPSLSEPFGERDIRLIKKVKDFFCSIRVRYFLVSIIALALGVGVYFLVHALAYDYIDTVYTSTENKKERERGYIGDLQQFVTENQISSEQTGKISRWAKENRYVYLVIYKDDQLFYTSDDVPKEEPGDEEAPSEGEDNTEDPKDDAPNDGDHNDEADKENKEDKDDEPGGVTIDYPTREELLEYAKSNNLYPLELSDGTAFASVAEFTEYLYYDLSNIASFILAAIVSVLIIMVYMHLITNRILRLGNDVNKVAEGDTEHKISLSGSDELARLSVNVDNMRNSMIENFKKERAALDANAELITSMSHDIRTPLTVLLGYMDVMRNHSGGDRDMLEYINAAESTALRLKKLSDDMFGYFLVFSGKKIETDMQSYPATTLIEQLLSEHMLLMGESGYDLRMDGGFGAALGTKCIYTDVVKLLRVIDNVFSNLYKYADKAHPISILVSTLQKNVVISFENKISKNTENVESNGIGLKTCKKLCELISAEFEYCDVGDEFHVNITLPIKDGDPV